MRLLLRAAVRVVAQRTTAWNWLEQWEQLQLLAAVVAPFSASRISSAVVPEQTWWLYASFALLRPLFQPLSRSLNRRRLLCQGASALALAPPCFCFQRMQAKLW